ncbi:MAG: alpha-L-fucosidase [Vicinamibacteria bacterium]|nr:alpha-L-fucosidase [Vicinamibacteria bacterium]
MCRALVLALGTTIPHAWRAPVPSPAQLAWQRMEMNAFVHFGPNTFTGEEWGDGREDPALFNPTALDARQWTRAFKAAGFGGVILTVKHHDGFALWPSRQSTHTVARSPWRQGSGDVVRDVADAARADGLKFGVYLSPWDRNHPTYGTAEYNRVFAAMLEEVLGGYGPVFEVWFDGANGEGPNGRRQVYDWPLFIATVRRLQPQAVIFSDGGPDIRWVGNERGEAPLTVWATIDRARYEPGTPLSHELSEGTPYGADWVAPECDVSIRPGWFYRAAEDARVKSASRLFTLYEQSVGRNCTLLLNVPPDRRGLIADPDLAALAGMRTRLDRVYGRDLATGASRTTADRTTLLRLPAVAIFDRVVVQEDISAGQHVAGFEVEVQADGAWRRIATGSTVGYKRILPVPLTTASAVRVSVLDARGTPRIGRVSLHRAE